MRWGNWPELSSVLFLRQRDGKGSDLAVLTLARVMETCEDLVSGFFLLRHVLQVVMFPFSYVYSETAGLVLERKSIFDPCPTRARKRIGAYQSSTSASFEPPTATRQLNEVHLFEIRYYMDLSEDDSSNKNSLLRM